MSAILMLMLPAFTACVVLLGIHVYLGIHVLSRGFPVRRAAQADGAQSQKLQGVLAALDRYHPQPNLLGRVVEPSLPQRQLGPDCVERSDEPQIGDLVDV